MTVTITSADARLVRKIKVVTAKTGEPFVPTSLATQRRAIKLADAGIIDRHDRPHSDFDGFSVTSEGMALVNAFLAAGGGR